MNAQLFNYAHGVQLTNSNITVQYTPSSSSDSSELSALYDHCAPGAFLNSKERYDPPKCSSKTRQALLFDIRVFMLSKAKQSTVFWLTGSAGAGKSALSQTLAEQMLDEKVLLGCHFFSRTSLLGHRADGYRLVPNLIVQFIKHFPEARALVERLIRQDRTILEQEPNSLLNDLFIVPLSMVIDPDFGKKFYSFRKFLRKLFKSQKSLVDGDLKLVVIIDGLDECDRPEMQVYILQMIARAIPKLPHPVRFLIASRPESHIRSSFDRDFTNIEVHRMNLDEDQNVRQDLRQYFMDRFDDLRRNHPALKSQEKYANWPSQEDIDTLVDKSSTQFIYADTVMNYISHGRGHPVKLLRRILGLVFTPRSDKPYLPLDTLYRFILQTVEDEDHFIVWEALRLIYLSGRPEFSSSGLRASPSFLEEVMGLETGEVLRLLDPLVSLFCLPEKHEKPIQILHASLFDYLCDPYRSEDFTIFPLSTSHNTLTDYFYRKAVQVVTSPGCSDDVDLKILYLRFLRHLELSELSEQVLTNLRGLRPIHTAICRNTRDIPGLFHLLFVIKRVLDVFLRKELKGENNILHKYASQFYRHFQTIGGKKSSELKILPAFGSTETPFPPSSIADIQHSVYVALVGGVVTSPSRLKELVQWLDTTFSKGLAQDRESGKINTLLVHLCITLLTLCIQFQRTSEVDSHMIMEFARSILRCHSWSEDLFTRSTRGVETGKGAIQVLLSRLEDAAKRRLRQEEGRQRRSQEAGRRVQQEEQRQKMREEREMRQMEEEKRRRLLEKQKQVDEDHEQYHHPSRLLGTNSPSDSTMIRLLTNAPQPSPLSFRSLHLVPPSSYPIELRLPSMPGDERPLTPLILDPHSPNGVLTIPLQGFDPYVESSNFSSIRRTDNDSRLLLPSAHESPRTSTPSLPIITLNDTPIGDSDLENHPLATDTNPGALTIWNPRRVSDVPDYDCLEVDRG
ncbi:hypothetical protein CPB83DRAFT_908471 [Crepidotus variabilis]|uniref:Nephrocystin 3-like N-terminal domain-containing protein n=1 Tax=Crepidotus variabilis TaxID=179855 RepID=A0A9P6EBH8_9AGAR|nr:hypothetical protein CPB83DRAFT_908471 [Crepidotus variabilis]